MLNIVIFGPPGSGKGTQSVKIAGKYGLVHLSTGDLLREEIEKDTELGRLAKSYIDEGMLVPDDVIMKELHEKVSEYRDSKGFIFDGFPRTIVQAEKLDNTLAKENIPIKLVLNIDVEDRELIDRMLGRAADSNRSDDKEDIINKRIEIYKEQSYPLIDYYKSQGKLSTIHGMAPVEEVFSKICCAIDEYISSNKILSSV